MSKAKLQAARELIEEKNYAAARTVLLTVHDPIADRWLAKLDRITGFPEANVPPRRQRLLLGSVIGLVLLAILAVVIWLVLNGHIRFDRDGHLRGQVDAYCRRVAPSTVIDIAQYCREQTPIILTENEAAVRACYARANDGQNQTVFMQCMFMSLNVQIGR